MGEHAVVLGASIGGLLAARVLSEFYEKVTVVERDMLPDGVEQRRGVPQGRHAHVLLTAGSDAVGELFPGILDELADDGAVILSTARMTDFWQVLGGHNLRREAGAFTRTLLMYQATRPFLEGHVRRRLAALPAITMLDGHDVVRIAAADRRVTGVRVAPHRGGAPVDLSADLVVDAMGRGARAPAFLEELGYGRPAEISTPVRVAYTSQLLRIAPPALPAKLFVVAPVPGRPTGGAMMACEDDLWILTALGVAGNEPPPQWEALMEYAAPWAPAPMMSALRRAEPTGDAARYRYATTQWRRYDRMRRFPEGLLVFGDAICSFNPIYGQGMSVAALEAAALRRCLRDGEKLLAQRFFDASARTIKTAWTLSNGADLSLPEIAGRRTTANRVTAWYTDRMLARCSSDLTVAEAFLRVTGLLDPPSHLMTPGMLRRVLGPSWAQSSSDEPSRSAAAT